MKPYVFGVVGGGWRTEFFLRVATDCPERFRLTGAAVRNPKKRALLARRALA